SVSVVPAPSSLSSFVHTRRLGCTTSRERPTNAMGWSDCGWPNTKRCVPPTRTSAAQERKVIPNDLGAHHRMGSAGVVQPSKTKRAGPSNVRVTTSSRSEARSTFVRPRTRNVACSLPASIDLLLPVEFLDHPVQFVEAGVPELAVSFDPGRFFLQP